MRYGHFDDVEREYVITRPDTPLPWINYLGSEEYFGIISNTAGGYSFYRDARLRRLTRYRYNNAPLDLGGRYVYLRDDASGDYWSPSWQPTQHDLEDYSCRHGLGYTIISSRYQGIRAEALYFVPGGDSLEIWRVRVTNERSEPARLSLFSSIEFCLWDAQDDATNFQRNYSVGEVEVEDGVIYHKTEYRERRDHFAYFACSEPLAGFDTQRDAFLGPYRSWDRPIAVERGTASTRSPMAGSRPARIRFGSSWARERQRRLSSCSATRRTHGTRSSTHPARRPSTSGWSGRRSRGTCGPPWWPRRSTRCGHAGRTYSRSARHIQERARRPDGQRVESLPVHGHLQHVPLGLAVRVGHRARHGIPGLDPGPAGLRPPCSPRARERLIDVASTQLPTGGAYHQYQPLTKRGNNDIGSGFNDDPLWLVLAVAAYLKETGDASILDEALPYDNQAGTEQPLYEHLQRSIGYTLERLGPHGLPLIGRADWNDCLNLNCFSETPGESFQTTENRAGGVAESVFIAGLFVLAADEMAAIAALRADASEGARCRAGAAAMREAVARHGWDGAWFRRAYDFHGRLVGAAENDEGQIFIEPQGMCVLAGLGLDDGRARIALDSVRDRLVTRNGIVVLQPAFTRYHLHLGEISTYPAGYKENGAVFCHTNPWVMIAETRTGNGDAALDYYLRINPSAREDRSEVHRGEPYVYAQMIAGDDAAAPGEAKNTWLTGTAAWNFVAISQWILGVRPEHAGLRIDPCVPITWGGFTVTRQFRGATYLITVHKESGVSGRVARLRVDGRALDGNLAPLPTSPGAEIEVEAFVEATP